MSVYYHADDDWFEKELVAAKRDRETSLDYEKEFPHRVDLVDQFQGHDEDGYAPVRNYKTLEEAVAIARRITEEALLVYGSVYGWHGMGDAGLVYHNKSLVWDGIKEYTQVGDSDEVSRAVDFATKAHQGQCRKGTNIPYISHPKGVSQILIDHGCSNKLVICGLLHDTLEDTQVTYEDLKKEFGLYVAEIVKNLSHAPGDDSWRGKRSKMIEHLKVAAPDVHLVSCSDKLNNMRAIHGDVDKLGDDFWKRFNASKDDLKWYYCSLRDLFKGLAKHRPLSLIASELEQEVNAVFESKNTRIRK